MLLRLLQFLQNMFLVILTCSVRVSIDSSSLCLQVRLVGGVVYVDGGVLGDCEVIGVSYQDSCHNIDDGQDQLDYHRSRLSVLPHKTDLQKSYLELEYS